MKLIGMVLAVAFAVTPLPQTEVVNYPPTNNSETKVYESYTAITDVNSPHYQLLHGEGVEHHDGGLITVNGYYAVALGQNFGNVGDKFIVTLREEDQDKQVPVIMCDSKQGQHTMNGEGWLGQNGHVIEVIVNMDYLDNAVRTSGNMNDNSVFEGEIVQIEKEVF